MAVLTQGRSLHSNQRQSRERKHWSTFSYRVTWLQVAPQEEPSDPALSPDSPCPPLAAQRAPRSEARCWVSTCQGPILTSPLGRPRGTPVTVTLANRKHNCSAPFAPTSPVQLLPPWQQPCLPLKRTEDMCRGWPRGRKHQGRVVHGLAWHDQRQCWGWGGTPVQGRPRKAITESRCAGGRTAQQRKGAPVLTPGRKVPEARTTSPFSSLYCYLHRTGT